MHKSKGTVSKSKGTISKTDAKTPKKSTGKPTAAQLMRFKQLKRRRDEGY